MSHHDPHPHDETALKRHDEDEAAVARRQAREDVNLDVSLSSLPALIATVGKLLGAGVTVGELAEKAAEFLAPSDLPAVEAIVAALEAAQKIVNDLAKEKK